MHVLIVLLMEGNEWRKKITKAILAWKKERFNGYLDGMKTMFRRESPDDAWLTWMIEALRAGELSFHVGRVNGTIEKERILWREKAAAPKKGVILILFGIEERRKDVPYEVFQEGGWRIEGSSPCFERWGGDFQRRRREGDCIINSPRNSHKFSSKWAATFHHTGEHTRFQSIKERSMLLIYKGRNRLPRSQRSMHNTQGTFLWRGEINTRRIFLEEHTETYWIFFFSGAKEGAKNHTKKKPAIKKDSMRGLHQSGCGDRKCHSI